MAMNVEVGNRGDDVRNDIWIRATDSHQEVHFSKSPMSQAKQQVLELRRELNLERFGLEMEDSGAFEFTISARIRALAQACGLSTGETPAPTTPKARTRGEVNSFRSRLYLPGNTPKFFVNAHLHEPDIIILDLEDSVADGDKSAARFLVQSALRSVDFGACFRFVRINSGPLEEADIMAVAGHGIDGILIPKCESADDVIRVVSTCQGAGADPVVIPIIESALGMERAFEISGASVNVVAVAMGLEDYRADIRASRLPNGEEATWALSRLINAARAAGVEPLASVWSDVQDEAGLRDYCLSVRARGASGVGCLHPAQIQTVHGAFAPTKEESEWAYAVIEAFQASEGAVTSLNGQMIDVPIARRAESILRQSERHTKSWRLAQ